MKFDIMTLFPDTVLSMLNFSIMGRAQEKELFTVEAHDIRNFAFNKHRRVDDTPYGGGMGMLMATDPIYECYKHIIEKNGECEKRRVIYMSPRGRVLTQSIAKELSEYEHLIILCGHYEGIDQRIIDTIVDEEISVGDYVVSGGEMPACILVDCISRLLDGVLSDSECHEVESIESGLLEFPQYTRPYEFMGQRVPDVLISGNHQKIAEWRLERSLELTRERRPDLYEKYMAEHPPKPKKKKRGVKPDEA